MTRTFKTKPNSAFKVENTQTQFLPLTRSKRFLIDSLFRRSYNSPRKYKVSTKTVGGRGRKQLMGRKLIM